MKLKHNSYYFDRNTGNYYSVLFKNGQYFGMYLLGHFFTQETPTYQELDYKNLNPENIYINDEDLPRRCTWKLKHNFKKGAPQV